MPDVANTPAASTAAPDLSVLSQPGSAAQQVPYTPPAATAPLTPYQETVSNPTGGAMPNAPASTTSSQTTPPAAPAKPVPHQKLMAMVQGLADALSGFSAGVASKGKVSGAEVVQNLEAQREETAQRATAAAQQQKNADLDFKVKSQNLALANFQLHQMVAANPDEMARTHAQAQQATQGVIGQAQDIRTKALQDFQTTGDYNAYLKTTQQLDQTSAAPGAAAPTPMPAGTLPPAAIAGWKNSIDTAALSYSQDPDIKAAAAQFQAAQALPDKQAASLQMAAASRIASNRKAALDAATTSRKGQAEATTAEATAANAPAKSQADIALAKAREAAATNSATKSAFELGQEQREANSLRTPDVTGFSSSLTPKEYDKRYDNFTKSKDYQTLSTLKGSYQQFQDTLDHIAATGEMTGAESVVGLFNAIGISATPLAGKGFRINANTVAEHQEARGMDQAAYQKLLKLKNGDVITPQQMKDYSNIAAGVYHNSYVNAADEAHRLNLPVDFLPQGGGKTPDPVTARIFTDVVLHTNPKLSNDKVALKKSISDALKLNGWSL